MALQSLPQVFKKIQLSQPVTTNGGVTSDVISLKHAIRAWITVHLTQAVGHATALSLRQATDVAAGTNAAGPVSKIWANEDVAASDALVAQTAAASYTVANNIKNKMVVFEVDPASLTDGYDCVYLTVGDSSQATNLCSIEAEVQMNFQQGTPPSVIVD